MKKSKQANLGTGSTNKLMMCQKYSEVFFDKARTHNYHKFYSKFSFGLSYG